jgi:hypothetical protein
MKKSILFLIVAVIFCSTIKQKDNFNQGGIGSCTDYRDAFTGRYFCHRNSVRINGEGPPDLIKDTISIVVAKSAIDSMMEIAVGSTIHIFKLKNNNLSAYPNGERRLGSFFASDSIRLSISYGHGFALRMHGKRTI